MAVRKKQDDSNLKILRELVTSGGNRQCFDCGQKGPTYANITIGSFVCTRCSGVLRGLTPPHRVKSISMATFTQEEIDFLKSHGNDDCAKTWLGLWDPKRTVHQDQRELMIDKYERKRYFLEPASPLKSLTNAATSKLSSSSSLSSSSVSSLSTASNINHNNNNNNINNINNSNNSNMSNGYTYLSDNNTNNNSNNNNNYNYHKSSNFNGNNSSSLNNGHHQISNGILAPPSPRHHNVTSSSSSLSSAGGQNGFNGTNVYHRPHSSSYYQQQQQQQQQQSNQQQYQQQQKQPIQQNGYTNGFKTNGFTPDSDFVADFGSASIVTANPNNGTRIKAQQNDISGNNNGNNNINGTFGTVSNGNVNENFADFEHAPIYNAAGMPLNMNNNNNFAFKSSTNVTSRSNSIVNSTPPADRYAALKDLDEQLRETKSSSTLPITSVFTSEVLQNSTTVNNANPFKTVQPVSGNPFQTNGNLSYSVNGTNGSLYDNTTSQQLQVQQQTQNISNGFVANTNYGLFNGYNNNNNNNIGNVFNTYNNNVSSNLIQQQPVITGNYASMKNPFMTTTINSNNPFL